MKPEWLTPVNLLIPVWVCYFSAFTLFSLIIIGGWSRLFLLPLDHAEFLPNRLPYSFLANMAVFINPLGILTIEKLDKCKNHTGYMIVSNHPSVMDIAGLQNLYKPYRWVSKAEN